MHRAGAEVLQLGAHERAALARLHVLELDDGHEPLGEVQGHAVLQVVRGDAHGSNCSGSARLRSTSCLGNSVRASAPVVGDDDGVLDPHATDAGEVDAGLDGHDDARVQGTTGRLRDPRRLVDLEADAVAGAVRERVAPTGGLDHVATRAVDRRALDAGRDRVAARPAGSRARRPRAVAPRDRDRRRSRCGSCRSSTRRRRTRSRSRRARRARSRRSLGRACGFAPFGPDATIVSKLLPHAPRSRIATLERAARTPARSGRRRASGSIAASASSAIAHAARMRATSPGSFTRRSASTRSSVGHELDAGERLGPRPLLGPGDAVGLEPEPGERSPRGRPSTSTSARRRRRDLDRGRRHRRASSCSRDCVGVATVGDQHELVGRRPAASRPSR